MGKGAAGGGGGGKEAAFRPRTKSRAPSRGGGLRSSPRFAAGGFGRRLSEAISLTRAWVEESTALLFPGRGKWAEVPGCHVVVSVLPPA